MSYKVAQFRATNQLNPFNKRMKMSETKPKYEYCNYIFMISLIWKNEKKEKLQIETHRRIELQ